MNLHTLLRQHFDKYVLFEDNHLLIVNKPAGVLSQGDSTGDDSILDFGKSYIKYKYNKPGAVFLHPVHRLDRPTSGVLILARTSKGLERMQELFRKRDIIKTYWALTAKKLVDLKGTLTHYLVKDPGTNTSKAVSKNEGGNKKAVLHYELMRQWDRLFLYKIKLETGRSHQIRAQLSNKNAPIVGDLKYGYKIPNPDKSICLHSHSIEFIHPVKKEKIFLEASILNEEHWHDMI